MSVPAFNQPVVNLPTDDTRQGAPQGASAKEAKAPVIGSPSSGPSFSAPVAKSGPVFAGAPPLAPAAAVARDQGASQASTWQNDSSRGVFGRLKGFFFPARPPHCGHMPHRPQPGHGHPPHMSHPGHGHLPHRPHPGHGHPPQRPHPIHGGPPPRPFPQQPDPHYSKRSHEQLAQQLLDKFQAFTDPRNPGYVTRQSLSNMAARPLTGNPGMDQNIRLAREILKRPELMGALDRDGRTGVQDNRFSWQNINDVVRSSNPLKFQDDKQLASAMLENFNKLKGGFWSQTIKVADLRALAQRPLTGNPQRDQLILLAKEVVSRSSLLQQMDNIAGHHYDGRISRQTLRQLMS